MCFENISLPDSKTKNNLFEIYKRNGLSITVEFNLIVTEFLDVTFDRKSTTYYPYRKSNNERLYINKCSSHSKSISNQMISNQIEFLRTLVIKFALMK